MSPSKSLSVVPISVRPYQGSAKIIRPSPAGTMQAALPIGRSAASTTKWVPRLGAIRGTSSSSTTSGRIESAQTPVALTTWSARTSIRSPESPSTKATPAAPPLPAGDLDHLGAVQHHRAVAFGLAEHGQHQPHVVGLAVVEEVGVVRVARGERRDQPQHLVVVDRAMAVRGPPLLVLAGLRAVFIPFLALLPAAAAGAGGRHHVVHVQPEADLAVPPLLAERGDQERGRVDEVRRQVDEQLALQQRLAHQSQVEVLQVTEAAVDHLRGAARGADGVVVALQQGDRVAARGGVQGHPGAGDAAADHDDLEVGARDRLDRRGTGQHRPAPVRVTSTRLTLPGAKSMGRGYSSLRSSGEAAAEAVAILGRRRAGSRR